MSSVKDFRKQYQEAQMKKLQVLIEDLRRRFIELHTGSGGTEISKHNNDIDVNPEGR